MILTYISLLIPAFSLLLRPRALSLPLRPCSLLLYRYRDEMLLTSITHNFGGVF